MAAYTACSYVVNKSSSNAKRTFTPYRQGHDISHTHTLVVAVHLRLAARLDTWLDSSLLCLSTPHMLWTRGENTLQGSGVQNPTRTLQRSAPSHCSCPLIWYRGISVLSFLKSWNKTFYKGRRKWKNICQCRFQKTS